MNGGNGMRHEWGTNEEGGEWTRRGDKQRWQGWQLKVDGDKPGQVVMNKWNNVWKKEGGHKWGKGGMNKGKKVQMKDKQASKWMKCKQGRPGKSACLKTPPPLSHHLISHTVHVNWHACCFCKVIGRWRITNPWVPLVLPWVSYDTCAIQVWCLQVQVWVQISWPVGYLCQTLLITTVEM